MSIYYLEKVKIFSKCIIINSDGKILTIRRRKDDLRRSGAWNLPGGGLEKGEHIIDSVVREVSEEVCLIISNPEVIYVDSGAGSILKDVDVLALMFATDHFSGEIKLSQEHDTFQWVQPKGFLTLDTGEDGGFLHAGVRVWMEQFSER